MKAAWTGKGWVAILAFACRRVVPLPWHSFVPLRKAVAVLCMALAVMLSGQAYISLMDRIEHAHHHAHFANPLAGEVGSCVGGHDACAHVQSKLREQSLPGIAGPAGGSFGNELL